MHRTIVYSVSSTYAFLLLRYLFLKEKGYPLVIPSILNIKPFSQALAFQAKILAIQF
jgi:hypothetical protein